MHFVGREWEKGNSKKRDGKLVRSIMPHLSPYISEGKG